MERLDRVGGVVDDLEALRERFRLAYVRGPAGSSSSSRSVSRRR
jgi:hypothetical protein